MLADPGVLVALLDRRDPGYVACAAVAQQLARAVICCICYIIGGGRTVSDTLTQANPQTDAEYEELVRQLFAEMSQIEEQMDRHRAESERLKFETQVITQGTDAKLARLEEQVLNLSRTR